MRFDEEFTSIEGGYVIHSGTDRLTSFGESGNLWYKNYPVKIIHNENRELKSKEYLDECNGHDQLTAQDGNKEQEKNNGYFSLSDAADDLTLAFGKKEKTIATAKLLGKTLFNVGLFAGKVGIDVVKNSPDLMSKAIETKINNSSHNMTQEQIEKGREFVDKNNGKKLW